MNRGALLIIFISIFLGFKFSDIKSWYKRLVIFLILVFVIKINLSFVYPILLQVQNHDSISGVYSKEINLKEVNFLDKNGKRLLSSTI